MNHANTNGAGEPEQTRPLNRMAGTTGMVALTAAEHAVLHWLAAGRSNAQIGLCLGRSEKTVRNQLTRVYAKLGVVNRAEAVAAHMRMEFARHA
jgi:DNA-binding CsgD family transcriptional regulator